MQERTITITLEKAKEWYNSDSMALKKIALQAYSKEELDSFDFTKIKTFKDALRVLNYSWSDIQRIEDTIKIIYYYNSKASAAMFKLNIIRKALNKGYNLHLTKNADGQNYTWYPHVKFVTKNSVFYNSELSRGTFKKLGEITSEDVVYDVIGGDADCGNHTGLGYFSSDFGVGNASALVGFLGCATEEIAKHFGLYFGMLIMEAMYSDMVKFNSSRQEI